MAKYMIMLIKGIKTSTLKALRYRFSQVAGNTVSSSVSRDIARTEFVDDIKGRIGREPLGLETSELCS